MEIALDFAINCSPDHPYVREHPEWFYKRPDGTIKFAENPPKKYEDIYPLNFRCENWQELWEEMTSIILFWAEHGVRIFRVDNPHTKPLPFWEYLIAGVRDEISRYDLSVRSVHQTKNDEGAGQGWLHSELHLFHLAEHEAGADRVLHRADADRRCGNIFVAIFGRTRRTFCRSRLQEGGRPAFMIRAVLAATLSSVYGIYSGFELCENAALARAARNISIRKNISGRNAIGMRPGISRIGSRG